MAIVTTKTTGDTTRLAIAIPMARVAAASSRFWLTRDGLLRCRPDEVAPIAVSASITSVISPVRMRASVDGSVACDAAVTIR